jgi:Sulfotransferase family
MSFEPWLPLRDPVFILSPPLSFSSHFAATLGRHPQLYAIPETHLFIAETLHEWWDTCAKTSFNMSHGLVRAVAELFYGEQNETTVQLARAWLRRRLPFTTGYILELLAERVHPRALVEKSPSMIFHPESMGRAARMFPLARFIHLVEHPRRHGEAVVAAINDVVAHHPNRVPQWLRQLACFSAANADELSQEHAELDPQQAWLALNKNIGDFLEAVPETQKLRVRAEDILRDPGATLFAIAEWLAIGSDAEAIEAMKYPERSPYARFGPEGARYGDDAAFLRTPSLPEPSVEPDDLDTPFSWRDDGAGFSPEVRALARTFGYG